MKSVHYLVLTFNRVQIQKYLSDDNTSVQQDDDAQQNLYRIALKKLYSLLSRTDKQHRSALQQSSIQLIHVYNISSLRTAVTTRLKYKLKYVIGITCMALLALPHLHLFTL